MPGPENNSIRFALDRGGTFTDVFALYGNTVFTEKLLSDDPANYRDAPHEGIRRIIERITNTHIPSADVPTEFIQWIRMGTTVATNALLERKGTPCALIITKGFKDLLQIGYQNRPELFALNIIKPQQTYAETVEINERIRPVAEKDDLQISDIKTGISGDRFIILKKPNRDQVRNDLQNLYNKGIRSIAVILMHGYSFHEHEKIIGEIAREIGFDHISLSHEVMPRIRMVGRGDTTCIDAYLTPHITSYLNNFRTGFKNQLGNTPLHFMQSDGGLVQASGFKGSNAILSGPAGGVVGFGLTTFKQMGEKPVIGFDMGGTSTDVSRYSGTYELVHETETAGVRIQAPQLDIRTVAAGGGSRLFYRNSMLAVGPESSGAHPGPVCYRKNGFLALSDANLFLGRLHPDYFPQIFGPNENQFLDRQAAEEELNRLTKTINEDAKIHGRKKMTTQEVAMGFIDVANEVMVRPIREISIMRGYNIKNHVLACFGGAGGQHACAIARKLGIATIFIHRFSGILSALGMALADVVCDKQQPAGALPLTQVIQNLTQRLDKLDQSCRNKLLKQGYHKNNISSTRYLNLRYQGTDTSYMVRQPADNDFHKQFSKIHLQEFGFDLQNRTLLVDDIRVRAVAAAANTFQLPKPSQTLAQPHSKTNCYFNNSWHETPVYRAVDLGLNQQITGPALIIQDEATIVVEPDCTAKITDSAIIINVDQQTQPHEITEADPINLAIFSNQFMSIAEQMGRILQKTSLSTNIKERLDFSCAIFDSQGGLVANAPHVPVHLGAMGEAVRSQIQINKNNINPGDVIVSNHPQAGGSHLPDITVITPVFKNHKILFFVAGRGHHSDIGSISPGSMPPFSRTLDDEGLHIKSFKLVENHSFKEDEFRQLMDQISPKVRHPDSVIADLSAQIAANQRGIDLLLEMIKINGEKTVLAYMKHIQSNAENAVRNMLQKLSLSLSPDKEKQVLESKDYLDDGSLISLCLTIDKNTGSATFDFSNTGPELWGNLNAPVAVTQSAILYSLRCLIDQDIPLNQGCLNPITIIIPKGSLLNPSDNAAVVGGNVLTSQRIVDVILKTVQAAAASQGCMNNLTFGDETFGYYETIGGGSGAGPNWHGCSGVHSHMTNTRITDPEIMEQRYPVLIKEFSIREDSGGSGKFKGGNGLVREIEFLKQLNVAILSERRVFSPYGLAGGGPGEKGKNLYLKQGTQIINLGGKNEITVDPGDTIRILTPGGGGWGEQE